MKRKALGDILLEMGVIDELQLSSALAHHRQWGVPLGRALVEKRLCGQDHIVKALQRQTGLPLMDLRAQKLNPELARTLSVKVAQAHRVVPIRVEGKRGETLVVAIAAPATLAALDAVQQVSGKQRVVAHLASDQDIGYGLSSVYGLVDEFEAPTAPRFGQAARVENEHEFDDGEDVPLNFDDAGEEAPAGDATKATTLFTNTASPAQIDPQSALRKVQTAPFKTEPMPITSFTTAPSASTVLLYGWPAASEAALMRVIGEAGLEVRVVNDAALATARSGDVVLAPLPSVEAAVARGIRPLGKLVVAGKNPEDELPRALALSACGFVPAPLESEFVLHVLRRAQKREEPRVEAVA